MVMVDPAQLGTSATGIGSALTTLLQGSPVHPPLAADPVSVSAAARLTAGGSILAVQIAGLTVGLALTTEFLARAGINFTVVAENSATALATLNRNVLVGALPAGPVVAPKTMPDVRPPLTPAPPLPGSVLAQALHGGDPTAGSEFITSWGDVATAVHEAAGLVGQAAENLPDMWNSEVSTPLVREHLLTYRAALTDAGQRAGHLAEQARTHQGDVTQARTDVPTPQEFGEVDRQLRQAMALNARTGGLNTPAVVRLTGHKQQLETQGTTGYQRFFAASFRTTTPFPQAPASPGTPSGGPAPAESPTDPGTPRPHTDPTSGPTTGDEGVPASFDPSGVPVGPDGAPVGPGGTPLGDPSDPTETGLGAGELASLLPTLIPAILGGVGGVLGGVFSQVAAAPQALLQAAGQAASTAAQAVGGLTDTTGDDLNVPDPSIDPIGGSGPIGTSPAGGDAPTLPAPVSPSGPLSAPTIPVGVSGGAPAATPAMGGSMMPMSPMGMMPGGAGGGEAKKGPSEKRTVAVPEVAHSESVTGKVHADRIVTPVDTNAAAPEPPSGGDGGSGGRPIVRRRITVPTVGEER